jgi:hypothetical protein
MTARYDDDRLSAWLHDIAPTREPEHLLGTVLARTARTRRRPAWRNPERLHLMSAISSRLAPGSPIPWRLVAVAAALLVLVAGLLLYAGSQRSPLAPPFGLAANGPLYYSQDGDLFVRAAADAPPTAILRGAGEDSSPVISPDGSKVSFLRKVDDRTSQLWAMNPDGTNVHQLGIPADQFGWFEWAPAGDAAAVLVDTKKDALYIVPADGGPALEHDLGVALEQAYFLAPNGSRLGLLAVDPSGNRGIYIVRRDGTGLTRLALDAGYASDPEYAKNRDLYFWEASWSPSGDRLLYTQLEPASAPGSQGGLRTHLATLDANGAVVSDTTLAIAASSANEYGALWLPSGDGFVLQSDDGSRHWLSFVRLGANGPATPVELPVAARGWIGFQISPDGTQVLAVMPAPEGQAPGLRLVTLATPTEFSRVQIGSDATWQRRAIAGR